MGDGMSTSKLEPTIDQLHQWWWLHDGRWYQAVASRFGYEAANELNREAIKFVATRVGRTVAKSLARPILELPWPEVVAAFNACSDMMWPTWMMDAETRIPEPGVFESDITRNFALDMLERAGTLQHYDCPCQQTREGWFEGLGLQLIEQRRSQCRRTGGTACSWRAHVAGFEVDVLPHPSPPPRGGRELGG
jgi:hypothetical protein